LKLANSISLSVLTEHKKGERKKISDEKFMVLFLAFGADLQLRKSTKQTGSETRMDENFPFHKIHIQFSTQINLNA
jgi:hypothetical protein